MEKKFLYNINLRKMKKYLKIIGISLSVIIIVIGFFVYRHIVNYVPNWENDPEGNIIEDYYDKFRKKCEKLQNKRCCLSSVSNAESQNSPLFESNFQSENGIPMNKVECPNGSTPNSQYCETSYIWCEKN